MEPAARPSTHDDVLRWTVGCHLGIEVAEEATLVLHLAPARAAGVAVDKVLEVAVDGRPLPWRPIEGHHGDVVHVVRSPRGSLSVDLRATAVLVPATRPTVPAVSAAPADGLDLTQLTYLR